MCLDVYTQAQMKTMNHVFDALFEPAKPRAQPKPESEELAQAIAAATDTALHSVEAWAMALVEDVGYRDQELHALLRLAMDGDDMQFGVRLAQAIRRQVIKNATEETRDEWEEAHDQAGAA